MTTPKVTPALTPEEWGKWSGRGKFRKLERTLNDPDELYVVVTNNSVLVLPDAHFEYGVTGRARHALAALALHGQPFGFTREDVQALRTSVLSATMNRPSDIAMYRMLESLAARIEALLPPEESDA